MPAVPNSVLALDVGAKRIGVAAASLSARLPRPLTTLEADDNLFTALKGIVEAEGATALIVGYPRGLDGQHTAQTAEVEDFAVSLRSHTTLPIYFQDEALTSKQAEAALEETGKPYAKGDIDALAAVYILKDWLAEHEGAKA